MTSSRSIGQEKHTIIYLHGPARSGTTISAISLGQVADIVFNQPFTNTKNRQEQGKKGFITKEQYEQTLEELSQMIANTQHELQKESLVVIIKEVNDRIPLHLFQEWITIPSYTFVVVRDPHIQLVSMMKHNAVTFFSLKNPPTETELLHSLINRFDDASMGQEDNRTFLQFNEDKWTSLLKEVQSIRCSKVPFSIFDANIMRHDPQRCLKIIFNQAGLDETEIDSCITGFQRRRISFVDERDIYRRATKKAHKSNGLLPLKRDESLSSNAFTKKQRASLEKLIAVYTELLHAPELLFAPHWADLEKQSWGALDGVNFCNSHPFTTSVLL